MNTVHSKFRKRCGIGVRNSAGQALVEFLLVSVVMLIMVFGILECGLAIYEQQILVSLSREAANLSSRGTSFTNAVAAAIASGSPLQMNVKGYVILSAVKWSNGTTRITAQLKGGGMPQTSKVGSGIGNIATVPAGLPSTNQTLMVAEVFYQYVPVTPLGKMLKITFPSSLYDAAYF